MAKTTIKRSALKRIHIRRKKQPEERTSQYDDVVEVEQCLVGGGKDVRNGK